MPRLLDCIGFLQGTVQPFSREFLPLSKEAWCWSKVDHASLRNAVSTTAWPDVLDAQDVCEAWDTGLENMPLWYHWALDFWRKNHKCWPTTPPVDKCTSSQSHSRETPSPLGVQVKATVLPLGCFKRQRNTINFMLRKPKSNFILNLASDRHHVRGNDTPSADQESTIPHFPNPPRLYQLLKIFNHGDPSFIPPLLNKSGGLVEEDAGKANTLNTFFVRQPSRSAADGEPPSVNAPPIP